MLNGYIVNGCYLMERRDGALGGDERGGAGLEGDVML